MQYEITSKCEQGVKSVQIRRSNHVAVTSPVKPRRSGEKGWARRSGEQVRAVNTSERVWTLSSEHVGAANLHGGERSRENVEQRDKGVMVERSRENCESVSWAPHPRIITRSNGCDLLMYGA